MDSHAVVIIGTGFGGQCAAIRLRKLGITDFVMLERRAFMGGTWCQNSYPGAAVDVQSPLYSISSEPFPWSQMLADQSELQRYTDHVIDKHGLREKTVLNCNVSEVRWSEADQRWDLHTDDGRHFRAQFVISATGLLSMPVTPNFPGHERFQGRAFHTNAWDHSFDHRNKRVAIIGSGASAAQVIPAIAGEVKHLHVFQRTPHWVVPRPDRVFSRFERFLLRFAFFYRLLRTLIYWQLETRVIGFKYSQRLLTRFAQTAALDHLHAQVSDPTLREQLTPDYVIGCKRVILSNTLYPALVRPNVTLHAKDEGIASFDETGIQTKRGSHVELDLIVYATGYDATDGLISYPVYGRDGGSLRERWHEYPRAYLGTALPGFPNFFMLLGPNTGIGHTSAIFIIEAQIEYATRCIARVLKDDRKTIEVLPEAEDAYTRMIHSEMERTVWKSGGCKSWYQSKSGHVIAMFPGFSFTYWRLATNFQATHHRLS